MELPTLTLHSSSAVAKRWSELQKKINQQVQLVGGHATFPRIVASVRGLMADKVIDACESGLQEFGEDFVTEGVTKRPVIVHRFPQTTWHFQGLLHPKQMSVAIENFDWLDTFDRKTLLHPLQEALSRHPERTIKILLEVNPVGPLKKWGLSPAEIPEVVQALLKMKNVRIEGISCKSDLMMSKPAALKAYEMAAQEREKLLSRGDLPNHANEFAIGTSRDWEDALKLGSTLLRMGSAFFGKTAPSKMIAMDW